MVCSQVERVIILEHYVASKSSVIFREAFSIAYPDKEVPHKMIDNTPTGNNISGRRMRLAVTSAHLVTEQLNYGRTDFISYSNRIRTQEFNIAIGFVILWTKIFV
jgi:hypothetical protein